MGASAIRTDEKQRIRNEGNSHKYFHQMLNMADDELNAPQYRLLGHYVRWAGHGGTHEEGIRETARVTRLGKDTIRRVRQELCVMGYISLIEPTPEEQKNGRATEVTVLDRWGENIQRYSKQPVPNQVQGVYPTRHTPRTQSGTGGVPNWVALEEQGEEQEEQRIEIHPLASLPFDDVGDASALSSLRSELQLDLEGDSPVGENLGAFETFVETLDMGQEDDGLISHEEYERLLAEYNTPALYTCTGKDIAEMIAAWWEWVPTKPSKRGKPSTLSTEISIPTNREYAKNLFERGVRPADFVQVLFPYHQRAQKGEIIKEMPFQYVCPMVDQYVAEHWQDQLISFTQDFPRYEPKKPNGAGVTIGEDLWARTDLFVDIPPRYISIQDMSEPVLEEITAEPSEYDSWTAEDWAKNGDPL